MTEKMKSFKVQDAVKKAVDRPRPGQKQPAAEPDPPASAGFPKIEAIVEADGDLADLEARMATLGELAKASKSQKEKLAAQRALKAYERARALLAHLLETKARMSSGSPADSGG